MDALKYPESIEKEIVDGVGALTAAVGDGLSLIAETRVWNLISKWDKEDKDDKDDKEFEHTRGAKLVSDDARITILANKTEDKTKHACG